MPTAYFLVLPILSLFENTIRMSHSCGAWAALQQCITKNEQIHLHRATVFVCMLCSLLTETFHSAFTIMTYLSSLQLVLCHVAIIICLPVHHHSADYISGPLRSLGSFRFIFGNRVLLKPVLGGVAGVAHFITSHHVC